MCKGQHNGGNDSNRKEKTLVEPQKPAKLWKNHTNLVGNVSIRQAHV